jgi:hypothetical protein
MSKVSCPLHLVDTGAPRGGSAAKGADIFRISVVYGAVLAQVKQLPAESLCPRTTLPANVIRVAALR